MNKIKIVIVDDNKQVRDLVRRVLEMEDDIEICADAASLPEAEAALLQWQPHVAVVDLLCGSTEIDAFIEKVVKINPTTKIVILSAHSEFVFADKCSKAGAHGYVCKDKVVEALPNAIRHLSTNKEFFTS